MARTTTPFDDLLAKAFAEGEARGRSAEGATMLLRVLRTGFGEPGSAVVARILAEPAPIRLEAWLDMALDAPNLEAFFARLGQEV